MSEHASTRSLSGRDESAEMVTESLVRATLAQRAGTLAPENPPVDLLRQRGRHRRLIRDAMSAVGAAVLVCGVALGVHAASGSTGSAEAADQTTSSSSAHATVVTSPDANSVYGTPKGWKPGPRLQVPTYSSVPGWMQKTAAASELSADASKHHPVNQLPGPQLGCLTLGSSPLLWPTGFYAEGTPLTVFDTHGHAVYVLDKGFTGVDGPAQLGWGNGELSSGYTLTGCPSSLKAIGANALLIIFSTAAQ